MSISGTLANALSGLTAASRAAQLVSSNVSNAMTEGYARREIELSARTNTGTSAGVQVDGIRRVVDEALLRDRRLADAAVGSATEIAEFDKALVDLIGLPDEPGSLGGRVAEFEASLIEAASRPDSDSRLSSAVNAAKSLTSDFNAISDGIQQLRIDADGAIANQVNTLNASLQQLADLNSQILRASGTQSDVPGLLDQRQALIDTFSAVVPVRQVARENGAIALYSMGGALLLDGTPATFGFEATAPITPDMTIESGALSRLTINDQPVTTGTEFSPIAGGSLGALFTVRDGQAVDAQQALDALAGDLISRFEGAGVDPTLTPLDSGLFTDGGLRYDAANTVGLSGRIAVNARVLPSEGGGLWRLRDGLGASVQGPSGDSTLLANLSEAISAPQAPVGGGFSGAERSFSGLSSDLLSRMGQTQLSSERSLTFDQARRDSLRDAELSRGVDTDQEMQKLLLIEQAFAANARVIQTADQLIQTLLEI